LGQHAGALSLQADAKKIVAWNKYPPKGTRGFGPMFSSHAFGITEPEYPGAADDNLLVIVQIESRQGVENVEEIAAVDGIDVLFIGAS
jgi:4-hydroxy-2-oxoheptanedioate aldolase